VTPAAHPWRFSEAAVKAKARRAALEAFADELETERFTAEQIRFANLIVDELTRNGHMEPGRLFESPYTDTAPTRPIDLFPDPDVEVLRDILDNIDPQRLTCRRGVRPRMSWYRIHLPDRPAPVWRVLETGPSAATWTRPDWRTHCEQWSGRR